MTKWLDIIALTLEEKASFFFKCVFILERQRAHKCARGRERERERERERGSKVSSVLTAGSPMWGLELNYAIVT